MEQIDVGVFDEHAIFAQGVAAVLRDDPAVGNVAVNTDHSDGYSVAVTSIGQFRSRRLTCAVVVCAPERELGATQLGPDASALLAREQVTPDQLCGAIHAAAAGLRIQSSTPTVESLDDRTRSVLRLLADGAGTREISEQLGYSERTIKSSIQQAQHALGARSRAQAVAVALRAALI